ncbi:hypothetical protein [Brevundimonas sp.]|jgi:hypothetical protein|uniref:hypothetical protein n=1 Tax=Brevundimonas sp. TaxID=1871086 RepID=UPI002E0EEED3|nr:hypothetical protein [Brevundimonas sp.]
MQINTEALTFFGYMLAAGGFVFAFFGVLTKRRVDRLTAEIDAMKEAERLSKAK